MKTAIVTGGAGGIGSALVSSFCGAGYNVVCAYNKSETAAKTLCSSLALEGFSVKPFKADVSVSADAGKLIKFALGEFGSADVLINNAGVEQWGPMDLVSDEEWQRVTGVNLTGVFNCCRAAYPVMVGNKYGRIINISSVWGQCGASCEAAYSASKAGVIGLTKALAKELGPSGVTVNCIAPGAIATAMMSRFTEAETAGFLADVPLGRLGRPEEVAEAALFFASEKSCFITGQVLGVNGGIE